MTTISSNSPVTNIGPTIQRAREKASAADRSRTNSRILESQERRLDSLIDSAGAKLTSREARRDDIEGQLSPPPTKTVPGDGKKGGQKTVVDEREKDKLESRLRATELEITQAEAAVGQARTDRDDIINQRLEAVGVTEEQTAQMATLEIEIDALKTLSEADGTDLLGDEFQTELADITGQIEELGNTLPDAANDVLSEFWTGVATDLQSVQDNITAFITPDPAEVRRENNYEGYFNDVNTEMSTIINHLQSTNGADELTIDRLIRVRDTEIGGKSGLFLGGLTESDDSSLSQFLTNLRVLTEKIGEGESLTGDDIAGIETSATTTAATLQNQGGQFTSIVAPYFDQSILANLQELGTLSNNSGLEDFIDRFAGIVNHDDNNPDDLRGLTLEDFNTLVEFDEDLRDIVTSARDGNRIPSSRLSRLIRDGENMTDELVNGYGLLEGGDIRSSTGGGSSNSSGGSVDFEIGGRLTNNR